MTVSRIVAARVLARDDFACRQCSATEDLHVDHRVPVSGGGGDEIENLQTLCRTCNLRKGGVRRRLEPRRPAAARDLHARVTHDELGDIDQLAVEEDRTRSDMARILLMEALAARRGPTEPLVPAP